MKSSEYIPQFKPGNLAPSLQAGYDAFIRAGKFQEAAWLLSLKGHDRESERIQLWLCGYLANAEILDISPLGGGATRTYRATLANGISGVFKPEQFNPSANPNSEAGAFILDRLLQLNIVPCTVIRRVPGFAVPGSFQYHVRDARLASTLPVHRQVKPAEMLMLDYLMKNMDRYAGNYLYLKSLDRMVAIDNGWGLRGKGIIAAVKGVFIDRRPWPDRFGKITIPAGLKLSRHLYFKLQNLREPVIHCTLQPIIGPVATQKLLVRKSRVAAALQACSQISV